MALITVQSTVASARLITVTFSEACVLTAAGAVAENWAVQTGVQVLGVANQGPASVVLTTSEQGNGTSYNLMVPAGCVVAPNGDSNFGATRAFTGVGQAPTIISASPKTLNTLLLRYSQPMDPVTSTTKANYSFSPTLNITDILMQTETDVLIYTATQLPRSQYTLTVTGVTDAVGNSV